MSARRRGVFVSYRRAETQHIAGRLYDRLTARFPVERVFIDVDSLSPGTDFRPAVERTVAASDVLLALIGPRWAGVTDEHGRRRLDDPDDLVVTEIATALQKGLLVVPVLVDRATMPPPDQLPSAIRELASRQAAKLDHTSFAADADELVRLIERPGRLPALRRRTARRSARWAVPVVAVAVALVGVPAVRAIWDGRGSCGNVQADFTTSALDPRWTRTNDGGGTRTFRSGGGRLVVHPEPGADVRADNQGRVTAPYLNTPVNGDFGIETRVDVDPTIAYQAAGLLILHDQNNYVRLERGHGSFDAIAFEYIQNGVHVKLAGPFAGEPQPTATASTVVSLRLVRTGTQITAFWKDDQAGGDWQELRNTAPLSGEVTAGVTALDTAPAGNRAPFNAAFDSLSITCGGP